MFKIKIKAKYMCVIVIDSALVLLDYPNLSLFTLFEPPLKELDFRHYMMRETVSI